MCGKVHFHHLYVTGEFLSYAQSLCNMKDRENKEFFPLFEHNMVGFDFCFLAKSLRLWLWWTTNLSICGNNLTNLKYTLQTYSLNIFWKWTRTITMIRRWQSHCWLVVLRKGKRFWAGKILIFWYKKLVLKTSLILFSWLISFLIKIEC